MQFVCFNARLHSHLYFLARSSTYCGRFAFPGQTLSPPLGGSGLVSAVLLTALRPVHHIVNGHPEFLICCARIFAEQGQRDFTLIRHEVRAGFFRHLAHFHHISLFLIHILVKKLYMVAIGRIRESSGFRSCESNVSHPCKSVPEPVGQLLCNGRGDHVDFNRGCFDRRLLSRGFRVTSGKQQ